MKTIYNLTQFFILDLVYRKIFLVSLLLSILFVVISLLLGPLSYSEEARLSINFSLAGSQLSLIFLSVLVGAALIKEDINSKAIHGFLTSPFSRHQYVVAKVFAFSVVLFLMTLIMWFSFFISSVFIGIESSYVLSMLPFFGAYLESLVLFSMSLCFSLFLSNLVNISAVFSLFLMGHWLDTLAFLTKKVEGFVFNIISWLLLKIVPNLETLNWKSHLTYNDWSSVGFYVNNSAYALMWVLFFTLLSVFIFNKKDLA